jgi:hypothetical protein
VVQIALLVAESIKKSSLCLFDKILKNWKSPKGKYNSIVNCNNTNIIKKEIQLSSVSYK